MRKLNLNDIEWLDGFLDSPETFKSSFIINPEICKFPRQSFLTDDDTICLQSNDDTLFILHKCQTNNDTVIVLDAGISQKGLMHTINELEKCFDWIFENVKSESILTYINIGCKEEEQIVTDSGMVPIGMQSNPQGENKIFVFSRETWEMRNRNQIEQKDIYKITKSKLQQSFLQLISQKINFVTRLIC